MAYANAMLATLLRIQLNIIGASLYRELKPEEGNAQSTSESPQDSIQHVYLSLCKHFIDIGKKTFNKSICTYIFLFQKSFNFP